MKKKVAILGSTGSIGKTTFNIIKKNKKDFKVILLTTNKNIKEIIYQANILKVKNIVISSKNHYLKIKKNSKFKNLRVYNNLQDINKIFKKKIDYTMCAITGLAGLQPTLDSVKFSKTIAVANKESIICGWNLIKKELLKYKTNFIPIDSEHFSIWSLIKDSKLSKIEEIIITASGGPFLNFPFNRFKKINPKIALKHPSWRMGKKISIDSATMMNKVFEIIEAYRIFQIDSKKFKILIHPKSYLHAIIKFENGLTKMLVHDTNMTIPIFNSLYSESDKKIKSKKLDLNILNNLNLMKPNKKRFPSLNILKQIPPKISLLETVLITANDELVDLFLKGKIKFIDITKKLNQVINMKDFKHYKNRIPINTNQIYKLNQYVKLKIKTLYN